MVKAIAGLVLLLVAQPVLGQPRDWDVERHDHRGSGVRILVLRDYHLDAGQTANGPVVVLGGAARIDGHADDDVVVVGGSVRVGPEATIDGDLVTVGGRAIVDPKARILGERHQALVRFPPIDGEWRGDWESLPSGFWAGLAMAVTVLRLFVVFTVGGLLALFAPAFVRRVAWRAGEGPASAAAIGVACQIGFVPALVVLVVALAVTVVGIPLIGAVPFLMAAVAIAGTAGFTAVSARIGARIRGTTVEASNALFVDVVLGFLAVSTVTMMARLVALGPSWDTPMMWSLSAFGFLIEYLVWTVGIGAACSTLLARWNGPMPAAVPPPIPPAAQAI